jgi:hypothetical protein
MRRSGIAAFCDDCIVEYGQFSKYASVMRSWRNNLENLTYLSLDHPVQIAIWKPDLQLDRKASSVQIKRNAEYSTRTPSKLALSSLSNI